MRAMPAPARFCLAAGVLGLVLCVLNQFTAPELTPALERAAVLTSLMAVGLLLVAALWTRVQPLTPERVDLTGAQGMELEPGLPPALAEELAWGSRMLLTATPAASVLLHWNGRCLLRRGVLGATAFRPGAICERSRQSGRLVSLVDLRLYPGRDEFSGLPEGTPAVLVLPIGSHGWLLIGGWSPRCFSRSDEAWAEGWGSRLRNSLELWSGADPTAAAPSAGTPPVPPAS
jgi:hypothetical protein